MIQRQHLFHAEATAFHGELISPLPQIIPPHSFVKLKPEGGYLSQDSVDFRLERIFSFKSSQTQVSGRPDPKPGHGWATLATSVVEGLNILEVVTADRIVSQVSTVHYDDGYTPSVSFLGTRYENLRIAGFPVEIDLDLSFVGGRPVNDVHYHHDSEFRGRVSAQCERLRATGGLPPHIGQRYSGEPFTTDEGEVLEFSLVNKLSGRFPGTVYGHVAHVPNFGEIALATVKLAPGHYHDGKPRSTTFELTMLEVKLGCLADGNAHIATSKTNGSGGG